MASRYRVTAPLCLDDAAETHVDGCTSIRRKNLPRPRCAPISARRTVGSRHLSAKASLDEHLLGRRCSYQTRKCITRRALGWLIGFRNADFSGGDAVMLLMLWNEFCGSDGYCQNARVKKSSPTMWSYLCRCPPAGDYILSFLNPNCYLGRPVLDYLLRYGN